MLDMHYIKKKKTISIEYSFENKIKILESKVRFINEVISDFTIVIYNFPTKTDIIDQLYTLEYLLYQDNIITETKDRSISVKLIMIMII